LITIYGHAQTRTYRCLWMLNELGIEYEHVPTHYQDGGTQTQAFLELNPNAQVPVLVDGDLRLWESLAINLYLAHKYGKGLWPETLEDEGRTVQWSLWAMTAIEPPLLELLLHRALLPEDERDSKQAALAAERLLKPLAVLDASLADREHLLGGDFSVADLNVASVLSWAKIVRLDLSGVPHVAGWLDRCLKRDAARKARG